MAREIVYESFLHVPLGGNPFSLAELAVCENKTIQMPYRHVAMSNSIVEVHEYP